MSAEQTNDPLSKAPKESVPPIHLGGHAASSISLPTKPDYEVLDLIGKGGYGEVFLARDKDGRFWAVKVVYRVSFDHDRPYQREYEGISKFEPISRLSESQLRIVHVGRRDEAGYFYYIMELADDLSRGRDIQPEIYIPHTLRSELKRRKRIAPRECCHLMRTLTVALGNLHRHGLVHRDVKPANIIFVNGRPKLADPGLITEADQTMTCAGTEGYIPPEGPGSARADIYSLGMVLYEALTGHSRWEYPKLPRDIGEWEDHEIALELNRVIGKACQPSLRKRYQSAREMEGKLDKLALKTAGPGEMPQVARSKWLAPIVFVLCVAVGVISVGVVKHARWGVGRWAWGRSISLTNASPLSHAAGIQAGRSKIIALLGEWQGKETEGAHHGQAITFAKSEDGHLEAAMIDLNLSQTRNAQSVILEGNHLSVVFDDTAGQPVNYEGDIDFAWQRISGMLAIKGILIPLRFDYTCCGSNSTVSPEVAEAAFSRLLGKWDGRAVRMDFQLEIAKDHEGKLQVQWQNITRNGYIPPESLGSIIFNGQHLKISFNDNGLLKTYEGDLDGSGRRLTGNWRGGTPKGPGALLRLDLFYAGRSPQ